MTTETPESLQEIERLLNEYMQQLLRRTHGTKDHRAALLSAITRVVQESEKQVEIVKSLHRETREELYAKELLVAERDARIAELEKAQECRMCDWIARHDEDCEIRAAHACTCKFFVRGCALSPAIQDDLAALATEQPRKSIPDEIQGRDFQDE